MKIQLVIANGKSKGKLFEIKEGTNLIGRLDPDKKAYPEIDLEEEDLDAKVSRRHALIELVDGKLTIEDLGSLNGTYLNRADKLAPGEKHDLQNGDEVSIGKIFLRVEIGE